MDPSPTPRTGPRVKLSCQRCKQKKVRCNKADPQCDRCKAAGAACAYAPRRQRPRTKERDDAVGRLKHRLDVLETQMSNTPESATIAQSGGTRPGFAPTKTREDEDDQEDIDVPEHVQEHDQETSSSESDRSGGFYRMVNEAKNTTITRLCDQGFLTAVDHPPSVDNAIAALDGAMAALGRLKISPDDELIDIADVLTMEETQQCIEDAFGFLDSVMLSAPIDKKLMKALPDIISSPHVNLDPAVKLVYYNLVFHGRNMGPKRSSLAARNNYIKCLQAVPAWHESAQGTVMDLTAAVITVMTAITCFDYHLAWKIHCESCRFARVLGLHVHELPRSQVSADGLLKEEVRGVFWCLNQMDTLFRLFYDKPPAIKISLKHLDLPRVLEPTAQQPPAGPTIVFIVWTRLIFIITNFLEYADSHAAERRQRTEAFKQKVNYFCDRIEALLDDWPITTLLKGSGHNCWMKWLYADVIIGAHTAVILMGRKALDDETFVSQRSLRSGRVVVNTLIEVSEVDSGTVSYRTLQLHLLTFYPFCAFFVVYYHILSCTNPDDCKDDIPALEKIGIVLEHAISIQSEFIPISNAINALNRISKIIQGNRIASRNGLANPPQTPQRQAVVPLPQPQGQIFPVSTQTQTQTQTQGYPQARNLTIGADVPQYNFLDPATDLAMSFGDEIQPMGYTRAIENDFGARNWHESWWNLG